MYVCMATHIARSMDEPGKVLPILLAINSTGKKMNNSLSAFAP